jgi:hypothetical protein
VSEVALVVSTSSGLLFRQHAFRHFAVRRDRFLHVGFGVSMNFIPVHVTNPYFWHRTRSMIPVLPHYLVKRVPTYCAARTYDQRQHPQYVYPQRIHGVTSACIKHWHCSTGAPHPSQISNCIFFDNRLSLLSFHPFFPTFVASHVNNVVIGDMYTVRQSRAISAKRT